MSLSSSRIRITGFSSGLDTEALIKDLMQTERSKVNKVYRSKTKAEWKLEMYSEINTKLSTFSNKYMSVLSSSNIMSSSVYTSYKANFKENNYFKVTGASNIIPGSYNVTSVSMAEYATISGKDLGTRKSEISGTGLSQYLRVETNSSSLNTAGGVATGSTALSDVVNADGANAFGFTDDKTEVKFTVNGKSVVLSATDTIDDMVTKINDAGANVTASFDAVTGQVSFKGANINFDNVDGTVFGKDSAFGLDEGAQTRTLSFNSSMSLDEINAAGGPDLLAGASGISFSINGVDFSFDSSKSIDDIINEVNSSGAGVTMSFDNATGEMRVRSNKEGESITVENKGGALFAANTTGIESQTSSKTSSISTSDTIARAAEKMGVALSTNADGKFAFTINGQEFAFEATDTIKDMMNEVNSSGAGVKMYYSELTDTFGFSSTELGADSRIEFEGAEAASFFGLTTTSASGKDASITINGETITKATNSFTIDGMQFELTGNYTASGADGDTGYGVTFTQDTQSAYDKVKEFIDEYNKIVEELYNLTREEKFYDYDPLVDEEKAEMTEEEIDLWTQKAKSGIMRSDSVITGLLTELRSAAYAIVGESGMMACDIGITTSGKEGLLKIDEETFKKALADNPDRVAQVMTNVSSATDTDQKYAESGFVVRINSIMSNYRTSTRANQIQQQTEKIYDYESKIQDLELKLLTKEEALWAKYSSLETLMTQLNGQSDWLTQQLAYL